MCGKRPSQNRRTCCGTSISSATSLIVRNASGAFSKAVSSHSDHFADVLSRIDPLFEDRRRLEDHHPPRGDRHFLAGLGITADTLAFFAHHERAERRQLHRFATLETIGYFLEHKFDKGRGFS